VFRDDIQRFAPLYQPSYEHDACGTGFVADLSGQPSHATVRYALEAVTNLMHRGAVDADGITGDGAGVTLQLPRRLLVRELTRLVGGTMDPADLGLGMFFFPEGTTPRCRQLIEEALAAEGVALLAWRPVPVQPGQLGRKARATMPEIWQAIVLRPAGLDDLAFDRRLLLVRKRAARAIQTAGIQGFHAPSFSCRTVVYKGLFVARGLPAFYDDLTDPDCQSALALFHQRYSTNTFPTWSLAQPFRRLAQNGEINTLTGNRVWMTAREGQLATPTWVDHRDIVPVIDPAGSDSASLDSVLELLELSGFGLLRAMAVLVPDAWENMPEMPDALRAFHLHHAALMEPWDGPAALAFTDGRIVGAALDRNGLRPARYTVTEDGLVVLASETGVLDLPGRRIIERGRLGPGQMLAADIETGELWHDTEIKKRLAAERPYQAWVANEYEILAPTDASTPREPVTVSNLGTLQTTFGFTAEDQRLVVQPMAAEAKEPLWSMGDDAPLAVLSRFPQPLANVFRQKFAQVTNPPIDPLRETLVMSLDVYLGRRGSFLEDGPHPNPILRLPSPILQDVDLAVLRRMEAPGLRVDTLSATYPVEDGAQGLAPALDELTDRGARLVDGGAAILIVSDREASARCLPIPMPLAVGAIHHRLIRAGKRLQASIICDTADVWDVHQAAVLLGYGASAIHPYLALATAGSLAGTRGVEALTPDDLTRRYQVALEAGLRKVMSKMGVSVLSSYIGAQLFEILGLAGEVVERCFTGTPSPLGGLGFVDIGERVIQRHRAAHAEPASTKLADQGLVRYRRDGEHHLYSPANVRALQQAAEDDDPAAYGDFVSQTQQRPPTAIRDLLRFRPTTPVPLAEVEPAESIRRHFVATAMSLGSLSPEAYRTLAVAMNRIGARSNSGEGGEDPDWYDEPGPDVPHGTVKQVASARFGVTADYLSHASELEIKIAQGSKPGEGGQLPGYKVTEFIGRIRHATPGTALISPPPHHDIYSIEDLAQLIYDLKQVNPRARVGVKLVAEAGVGTIAAGVVKAYADYILISGHSGGTGASPLSSIKHAGTPWELGLAETQQTLVLNDLRGRVTLRTDGGLQTARDVVVAALLGAEEYGFGTAALVAIGCDMARQCHLNSCPTGIATQREDLRAKFSGKPEQVIAYFTWLAEEVRDFLAQLGARRMDDLVGRVELLEQVPYLGGAAGCLDLGALLATPGPAETRRATAERNDPPGPAEPTIDEELLPASLPAIEGRRPVQFRRTVRNHHRAIGARLAGEIAVRQGREGLPDGTVTLDLDGVAGESFGAWCVSGLRLVLTGEANDYVGKGMSGGEIIVRGDSLVGDSDRPRVVLGNTVLYGATGGALFAAGEAGERFAVRNSGATAVVEGLGDHGCEYMTGGIVVVLGETGRNFAAGMTGGLAFVYDIGRLLPKQLNPEYVRLQPVLCGDDEVLLGELLQRHVQETGSAVGERILADWDAELVHFWKVSPGLHP
jgi:glutamate synthase (NADPH/NADH) large chain/glutamate synthase (ferredoxin)